MIQDSVNRISYDGNGIATEFAYPFSITSTQDVKVMLVDTDGTETILTADYYVDEANAKVDYPGYPAGEEPLPELQPPVLATGQRVVIYRELDVTQLTSLFDQYPFKTIEVMIDKATILLQQLKDAQQRALTLSVSTGTDVSLVLPAPSPNKSFRWNSAGTGLELTADPATVLASVQGYTEQAEGYATTANEKAGIATTGANTATEQANLAIEAAETFTLATQAEAEAGTDNVKRMSPLRTKQAISVAIPSGIITMWSGAKTAIPNGWLLCDGTNGTPDLQDKFVIGAGTSYEVGATGGEAEHTLTVDEMPGHSHQMRWDTTGSATLGSAIDNTAPGGNGGQYLNTSIVGGGVAHNNMPPYYALCYIMKV